MNRWKIVWDAKKVRKWRHFERLFIWRWFTFIKKLSFIARVELQIHFKMHFSHDIVVVYWRHKFLLHNCRCKRRIGDWRWMRKTTATTTERVVNERELAFFYYFSQVAANEACNFFLPAIVNVAFIPGLHNIHVYIENHKFQQKKRKPKCIII